MADVRDEPNSLMSDSSFVVLEKDSLHLESHSPDNLSISSPVSSFIFQNEMISSKAAPVVNLVSSEGSGLNEASFNEIQMKLDHLVKENVLLKETLNQSNLAMKSQFDTLVLWQEEVVKTHESHKQKFKETKDQISRLQLENGKLRKMVEKSYEDLNSCDAAHISALDEDLSVSNSSLQKKLESTEDILKEMIRKNEELVLKNEQLEKSLFTMSEQKINLEESLKNVQEELALYRANESQNDIKDKAGSDKFVQCNNRRSLPNDMNTDNDVSVLSQQFENSFNITEIKTENNNLKRQLEEQKVILKQNCDEMDAMKVHYEAMWKNNTALNDDLKNCKSLVDTLRQQITDSAEQLRVKEEMLKSATQELELTKKEIQKCSQNCEEITILKEQIALYEMDFQEEKRAKEKAVEEKNNMANHIRFLESKYEELIKNKESKEKQFNESPATETEKVEYKCPLCEFCSTDVNDIAQHASDCGIPETGS